VGNFQVADFWKFLLIIKKIKKISKKLPLVEKFAIMIANIKKIIDNIRTPLMV